jgi:hypothetical protein
MVLDTSALLASLQGEPQRRAFSDALASAGSRSISTRRTWPARFIAGSARAFIRLTWTSAIASPTRWRRQAANRCFTRARIFR